MPDFVVIGVLVFVVAVAMTMVGKGGGNFYVLILAMANIPMHEAATTGQFILFSASIAAMVVFQKSRSISWTLAILIGSFTSLSALGGGYFSHMFSGFSLKLIFAVMLLIAGIVIRVSSTEKIGIAKNRRFGTVNINSGDEIYGVNLWVTIPVTVVTGFGSGMVGVSGGSFLVPLLVLACGVPMLAAVGTASVVIAATAFMGFAGHAANGDFDPAWAVPLAIVAVAGGVLGGRFAARTKSEHLKNLFAYSNWLAALLMIISALYTKGII